MEGRTLGISLIVSGSSGQDNECFMPYNLLYRTIFCIICVVGLNQLDGEMQITRHHLASVESLQNNYSRVSTTLHNLTLESAKHLSLNICIKEKMKMQKLSLLFCLVSPPFLFRTWKLIVKVKCNLSLFD